MFEGAVKFNADISGWDVSKITDMSKMFRGASLFNQDLSGWEVCQVEARTLFDEGAASWQADRKPDFESCKSEADAPPPYRSSSHGGVGVLIFTFNDSFIDRVELVTGLPSYKIKVLLQTLSGNLSITSKDVEYPVLEYSNITAHNIEAENVLEVRLMFNISKKLLSESNALKEDVLLLRFNESSNAWEELETQILSEDSENVRFVAKANAFSIFAISGLAVGTQEPEPEPILEEIVLEEPERTAQPPEAEESRGDPYPATPPVITWMLIVAILILAGTGFFVYHKRN